MSKPAPEASVFEPADDAAEARALAAAEAQVAAGQIISHEAVRRWLLSWGTPHELPPPKCGE
ncbi:MAG: CopG family transcriptional regulator [Rhizomicrobium sp.]